ncbi:MAG: peptidylprolyl isomerase [Anaerolineaceae bacterium]|nr:peptidylprolyl isomerase [Anaerolineaceae bacterium]
MSEKEITGIVEKDIVVTLAYKLTVEGELIDESDIEPIQFIQGKGEIIPGLENELFGLNIGEKKEITVQPKDGYGEIDPESIQDVPITEFPEEIPLEVGVELELKDTEGNELFAVILERGEDTVKLDFNDPLAGKELLFNIEILELRKATPVELEHGHVHED